MASRKPIDTQRPKVILPDLPRALFPDATSEGSGPERPASAVHPVPPVPVRAPRARVEPAPARAVQTAARQAQPRARARTRPQAEMIVLPTPRQVVGQTVPSLVAAISLVLCAAGAVLLSPRGLPIWAAFLLGPSLILFLTANRLTHPYWRNAALANMATVAVILPILAIRRFTIAVPSFEHGHGILLAPVLATLAAIVAFAVLALSIAFATREDPEYAGLLLLPACLMVPMCVGMSMNLTLSSWLKATALVFVATGLATVVASLLPGALAALVAPVAIALEFLFLTFIERTPVFPQSTGPVAIALFWSVLIAAVVLAVLLPVFSAWLGRIDRAAKSMEFAAA